MNEAADTLPCTTFATAPAPHRLFLTEVNHDNLATIRAWSRSDRALLILSGPAQVGKTVLASEVAALAPRSTELAWVDLGRPGTRLVAEVPKAFGIDSGEPAEEFARFLAACRRAQKPCLLIVDNAHLILQDGVKFLEELTDAPGTPQTMHVLLVWRDAPVPLADALLSETLRSRLGGQVRLQPHTPAETGQYIAHRFRSSNCACHIGRQPFDTAGLRLIHAASGGYPGKIDLLVQHCLARPGPADPGRLEAGFVHACLAELAKAGRLPYPLPALPVEDAADVPPPAAATATPTPARKSESLRPALEDRTLPPEEEPPAQVWPKPALLAASVIGLAALTTYAIISSDSFQSAAPASTEAALDQPLEARPSGQVETLVEAGPPDPRELLIEALDIGAENPEAAIPVYTRAALWGSDRAAYYLGQFYETGLGVAPDPFAARAWYQAAPEIAGAAARLRELGAAHQGQELAAPAQKRQIVIGSDRTELHWSGSAPRYRVEFFSVSGQRAQQAETALPAIVIDQPVARWRVVTLRENGTSGPASDWVGINRAAP
ncbi:ATP-binding protein [Paracoccus tibetensis]|uniref:Type II secretory pathway, component ExeA (Predicted ATPase) n=1 Tax=Paracoccus tibetensis TaxID=336292 RepID=A0A1G5I7S0_9RHOB|nr:ATP-binding protein [Paracoccus tibetensis]SCY72205.1 Type II secretory pathway, component ExeA (predicted ATPase) [Paracoccus tibetensis]